MGHVVISRSWNHTPFFSAVGILEVLYKLIARRQLATLNQYVFRPAKKADLLAREGKLPDSVDPGDCAKTDGRRGRISLCAFPLGSYG